MAHNRTVTFNTNSEVLTQKIEGLLLYINVAKQRILQDAEYPGNNDDICSIDEARHLVIALHSLFTVEPSDITPQDASFELTEFMGTIPVPE